MQEELKRPLFADGHVVSIYWENISRSIVERAHRDAKKLECIAYKQLIRGLHTKTKNTRRLLHMIF